MSECVKECNKTSCPFAFTDLSETVQNYGCLPSPYEILSMRVDHDKTWACHSDPKQPCIGGIKYLKEHGMPYSVIDSELLTERDDWGVYTTPFESLTKEMKELRMRSINR